MGNEADLTCVSPSVLLVNFVDYSKKKISFNSASHAAEIDASAMEEGQRSDTSRWGPDPAPVVEPLHVAVASLEASGKHCHAALN